MVNIVTEESKESNEESQSQFRDFFQKSKELVKGCMEGIDNQNKQEIEDYNIFLSLPSFYQEIVKKFMTLGNSFGYSLSQGKAYRIIDGYDEELKAIGYLYMNKGDSPKYALEQIDAYKEILELPDNIKELAFKISKDSGYIWALSEAQAQMEIDNLEDDLKEKVDEYRSYGNGRAGALAAVQDGGMESQVVIAPDAIASHYR